MKRGKQILRGIVLLVQEVLYNPHEEKFHFPNTLVPIELLRKRLLEVLVDIEIK